MVALGSTDISGSWVREPSILHISSIVGRSSENLNTVLRNSKMCIIRFRQFDGCSAGGSMVSKPH